MRICAVVLLLLVPVAAFVQFPLAPAARIHNLPRLNEGHELADIQREEDDALALQYGVTAGGNNDFFSCDTRVIFGPNALEIGVTELHATGLRRPLIVTGWNQARADPLVWELYPRNFEMAWKSILSEPTFAEVISGASIALEHEADCVIAMGGGSAIDIAKLIAAITYTTDGDHAAALARLLAVRPEGAGVGAFNASPTVVAPPLPVITVPLVSGSGAEVTPMAAAVPNPHAFAPARVTAGLRTSAAALPAPFMALVEPRLQLRLALHQTWPRAFVALATCAEALASAGGFVPDLLAEQGLQRAAACLSRPLPPSGAAYREREDIAFASVAGGLARSRQGWGQLHVLAAAVADTSGAPYALAAARLLPAVVSAQAEALERASELAEEAEGAAARRAEEQEEEEGADDLEEDGEEGVVCRDSDFVDVGKPRRSQHSHGNPAAAIELYKLQRVARTVTGRREASVADLVSWLNDRLEDKNIPHLRTAGVGTADIPDIVGTALLVASREGSGGGGFLREETLRALLEQQLVVGEGQRGREEGGATRASPPAIFSNAA